ncbi:hypothetical protein [Algoriphagus boritolerans]|uniref:hypothetical protein n=1 Tax=Algoriphagus boritolerans TaxID=308111 RepID=UPI000A9B39C9
MVAYLVFFILLIPSIFDRKLIRKTIHWAENNPTTKVLFAQNLEIIESIIQMPSVMWKLALVYLFQWYALFCYWQNAAKSIALSVGMPRPRVIRGNMKKPSAGQA